MALGLYMEGNNIIFDAQKVGELSIPEGTILYGNVVDAIIQEALTDYEIGLIQSESSNDGYDDGVSAGRAQGLEEGIEQGKNQAAADQLKE